MARSGAGEPEVHRITAAQTPHSDDLDARLGRYLLSMLIRTVCFVLMFAVHGWPRWILAAGAIFLPYVAVIFANAGGTRRPTAPPTTVTDRPRHELTAQPFDADEVRIYRMDEDLETAAPTATPAPPPAPTAEPGDAHFPAAPDPDPAAPDPGPAAPDPDARQPIPTPPRQPMPTPQGAGEPTPPNG